MVPPEARVTRCRFWTGYSYSEMERSALHVTHSIAVSEIARLNAAIGG